MEQDGRLRNSILGRVVANVMILCPIFGKAVPTAITEIIIPAPRETNMSDMAEFWIFAAVVVAFLVCGVILTSPSTKNH
jgi:hypothetical protein